MQVRSAEDLLSLSRSLKEMWIFGKLDTLRGEDNGKEQLDGDVKAVAEGLDRVLRAKERM